MTLYRYRAFSFHPVPRLDHNRVWWLRWIWSFE